MQNKDIEKKIISMVQKALQKPNAPKLLEYHPPEELKQILDLDASHGDESWDTIFDTTEKYIKYSVNTHNKQYFNQMWNGGSLPSRIGEIITACMNTSMYTYNVAPVATLIERWMIKKLLSILEFQNGEGIMNTGSSNGNQIALLMAKNERHPEVKEQGIYKQKPLRAYINVDAHYSFDKAMNVLGLGTNNLVKIPTDNSGKMDLNILVQKIEEDLKTGKQPFFIGATACTTVRGSYDPIDKLLAIKKKYNLWLHTDGAWGGVAFLHPELRKKYVHGIEAIDSFTFDAHKMLSVPLICSFLFINNKKGLLGKTCDIGDSSYIFHEENESYDLGPNSLQCGRRVDILKFYLEWQYYGKLGIEKR
ncbi:pyridoxal-dependent decarboxylase, partial [Candidatus Peregrinibacteria bacterium]|nr:pyridoxal-dependent decarboxylase [Candidatus Peregrinibacteria bacterium]